MKELITLIAVSLAISRPVGGVMSNLTEPLPLPSTSKV